jgi:serine acetyltransferase
MINLIKEDIACVFERDPAAQTIWEVVCVYPGFHAVLMHRFCHRLWIRGFKFIANSTAPGWISIPVSQRLTWAIKLAINLKPLIHKRWQNRCISTA